MLPELLSLTKYRRIIVCPRHRRGSSSFCSLFGPTSPNFVPNFIPLLQREKVTSPKERRRYFKSLINFITTTSTSVLYSTLFENSDNYEYFRKVKAFSFLSSIMNFKILGSKAPPLEGFGETFYLTTFTSVPILSIEIFISSPDFKVKSLPGTIPVPVIIRHP